ncbi:PAS domain S-box protein [Natronobacterium gregoryi]|uniref:histidine kinase n=2 Tax=Natronobacterium gregoryi TaxID=44930 RepID=L0AKU0_NATGS|nr:PAS domain S-box protein [Natronobacterium gregoryi]AFZ74518.1 PAS domain S-box [Natronobacterium gregoryi SP2]ELY72408.1 HTR-like protein [Natronobacterium gregoryi SP2]PLK21736.1 PAS domain S-box protein [Natronobacterium gregoryi SP2]SFI97638.1 PAS domain S-box-containing protein [Natronobacterium gregoryi]
MTDRILAVEDTNGQTNSLRTIFTRNRRVCSEVELTVATGISDATSTLETKSIDCILSRQELLEGTGVELLRTVRQENSEVPFFLFVAGDLTTVARDAVNAGVTEYLPLSDAHSAGIAHRIEDAIEAHHDEPPLAELLDSVPHAVLVYDPARATITTANKTACDYWGYTVDELRQQSLESVGAEAQPALDASLSELLEHGHSESIQPIEWQCEANDGTEFWTELTVQSIQYEGDTAFALHVRDITDEKRQQETLELFREAIARSGHSMYITDSSGEILYANAAFEDVTGYAYSDVAGSTPRVLKSGAHDTEYYRQLWETILEGETWQNEIINERKDGSRYIANQTIAPLTDSQGQISHFVAVNDEITDRKRREEKFKRLYRATTGWIEADSRSEACKQVSEHVTMLLECDLHRVFLSDTETDALEPVSVSDQGDGVTTDRPTFEAGEEIVREVYETGVARRCDDVWTAENASNAETDLRSKLVLPLGDHGVVLIGAREPGCFTDDDEWLVKIIASILTAVLDRIRNERQLEERNSRLAEFASLVSHDLRNPLNVATGHLELARESGDLDHLNDVAASHTRMEEIIEDLLWLSREGKEIQRPRPVTLESVVERAWSYVETGDATLETACERTIDADPDRLQQLFENLFRNAVEHGGEDVTVTVGLFDGEVGFYVEDTGDGIPSNERDDVFDSGYTTLEGNTGYGLSIVETVVEGHGWSIDLADGEDGGARFEVCMESE